MRKLIDVPNVDGVTADYPKGRVRDKAGATPGTTYTEILHGDIIQFFQKLAIDGSITENDLPDNVTNGYQLLEALVAKIKDTQKVGTTLTVERADGPFSSGTITITAESYDRMIYAFPSASTATLGVGCFVNSEQVGRVVAAVGCSYLLPAGLVSTIVWESGSATNLVVKSHKIGV